MTAAEARLAESRAQAGEAPSGADKLAPRPRTVIEPVDGWRAVKLGELWEFRELVTTLGMRDVRLVYKQTVLGVAWVVLQPLIGAAIFTFVFGMMADLPSGDVPYFAFALVGMIAWTFFSTTLSASSMVMVNNAHLVSKVYFPRLVLPIASAFQPAVNLLVSSLVVGALLLGYGVAPTWRLLLAPVWLLAMLLLALGVGFWCCSVMVRYRDLKFVVPVAVQFLLFASPVGYGLGAVTDKFPAWVAAVYQVNPVASLLEAFRWSVLGVGQLHPGWLAYSVTVSLLAVVVGALLLRRAERRFADVI